MKLRCRLLLTLSAAAMVVLLLPAGALAVTVTLKRLAMISGSASQDVGMVRTPDGNLHVIYQTFSGRAFDGLAAMSISSGGGVGTAVQALSGWQTSQAGLVALPGGTLEAVFGAISPSGVSGLWGITSTDGGATWSAPADVGAGEFISGDVTAATSGATPVITLGGLEIQDGLGAGASTYNVATTSDGDAFDVGQGVDASTGEVVDGWNSIASPGGNYLQGVAPSVGTPELMPGQVHNPLVPAGRDTGPGVFAAYTTDGTHVRLLRYGGGSVNVGALAGITATNLAAATGPDGRIWVIWGKDGGADFAVTRSNKAVTRFEPIQLVDANTFSLWRIFGDGRLGPLDLFSDEIAGTKTLPPPGLYYGRVFPELSANVSVKKVKNSKGAIVAFKLTVTVTDAGDSVAGAKVSAKGQSAKTSAAGVAKLTLPGSTKGPVTITITDPGYQLLTKKFRL
jgi:hypothetical protein